MPTCSTCDGRYFATRSALHQHMINSGTRHPYCKICDRNFVGERSLQNHNDAVHNYQCLTCDRVFRSSEALKQHNRDSAGHPYCRRCDRYFVSYEAMQAHRRDSSSHGGSRSSASTYRSSSRRIITSITTSVLNVIRTFSTVGGSAPLRNETCPEDVPLPESPIESNIGDSTIQADPMDIPLPPSPTEDHLSNQGYTKVDIKEQLELDNEVATIALLPRPEDVALPETPIAEDFAPFHDVDAMALDNAIHEEANSFDAHDALAMPAIRPF